MKVHSSIDDLIERSSLGTSAARALRARTTDKELRRIQELIASLFAGVSTEARDSDPTGHIATTEGLSKTTPLGESI